MSNVSRLDYQSEYNRVTTSLAEKEILLDASVLNLNEDMPTPYIYQCMMQIWTVEKLVDLALTSGVTITTLPERRRGQGRVAKISVEPMQAYFLSPQNEQPYLLEFPVKLSIEGTLESCMGFIDSLTGEGVFMPPRHFEIFAFPPANNEAGEDGLFKSGSLRLNLVCPSYLACVDTAVGLTAAADLVPTSFFWKKVRLTSNTGTTYIPNRLQQHPCGSGNGVRIVNVLLRFRRQHLCCGLHFNHHHIDFQLSTAQFTLRTLFRFGSNAGTAVKILNAGDSFQHYRRNQNNPQSGERLSIGLHSLCFINKKSSL